MQKIVPFLWFDTQAEDAARFYVSLFKDGEIKSITHYGNGMPLPAGTVMTVAFELAGQQFIALNGGPIYKFTPAISMTINCETQEELDELWQRLTSAGGKPIQCGWLTDKYGLSWQVVPTIVGKLAGSGDKKKTGAMMQALVGMMKLDIAALQRAYDQG